MYIICMYIYSRTPIHTIVAQYRPTSSEGVRRL